MAEWRPSSASETVQSLCRCAAALFRRCAVALTTVSLLPEVLTWDARTHDKTRAIQYAKLAGAAHCESSVPSWSCEYKCVSGVSNAENVPGCNDAGVRGRMGETVCVGAIEGTNDLSSLVTDLKVWKCTWLE